MSHKICHPVGIPIQCRCSRTSTLSPAALQNISDEELCFISSTPFDLCARVTITIDLLDPPFEGDAWVVGCRPQGNVHEVCVRLLSREQAFELRMAEQVCQIAFHQQLRSISSPEPLNPEALALEWIDQHAEQFSR